MNGEFVAHECTNRKLRPYPALLCSMCRQIGSDMIFASRDDYNNEKAKEKMSNETQSEKKESQCSDCGYKWETGKDGSHSCLREYKALDPIRKLIAEHTRLVTEVTEYAYFELAYTRATMWMAWLCSDAKESNPNRKILAQGQGETPELACERALANMAEQSKLRETFGVKEIK